METLRPSHLTDPYVEAKIAIVSDIVSQLGHVEMLRMARHRRCRAPRNAPLPTSRPEALAESLRARAQEVRYSLKVSRVQMFSIISALIDVLWTST